MHARFYLSPHTVSIGLIGPGTVGAVLLEQLASQRERLLRDFHLDLRVRGILTSKRMLLSETSLALDGLARRRRRGSARGHRGVRGARPRRAPAARGDPRLLGERRRWLTSIRAGWPRAFTSPRPTRKRTAVRWISTRVWSRRAAPAGSHYLYEATVGAGLPIIVTLRDLRETGDEIRRIEGIFSGTLAYLFNVWDGSQPFSAVVRDAKAKGFTEPDPRDDLSGMDVARKLVILGREMGLKLELADVALEGLIPAQLATCPPDEFMSRLGELDAPMLARLESARKANRVLRYVAALDAASRQGDGRPRRARAQPPVRQHQPDRQHRAVRDQPLSPEPARRAGAGRRTGGDRRRRVRRPAARVRVSRGEAVEIAGNVRTTKLTKQTRRHEEAQ